VLLYHFTSRDNLRTIRMAGLTRGTVHLSPHEQLNAVWLTASAACTSHGLEAGGAFMSDAERREALEWTGALPPPGARFPKNAEICITVELEPNDRNLHDWLPWARRHLSPDWLAHLHPIASGNLKKAKSWRLYFGIIPPDQFVHIEELEPAPQVVPLRPLRLAS